MSEVMQEPTDLIGTTLADRYIVLANIGRGGVGIVYRAHDNELDREVAIKLLAPRMPSAQLRARFRREARLAARIRHSGVVRVLDHGRMDAERLFLVMEFIDGVPLTALLDGVLDLRTSCGLVAQLLEALAHVHAREILHRDVKPSNVLVVRRLDGRLITKLADFGIAAALAASTDEADLTREGALLGTPNYMAPEFARGVALPSPTLDLYSVGVILYRMLAGQLPFAGTALEVLTRKNIEDPPAPARRESWPSGLWPVIAKLLERQPEHRYATSSDALAALRPYCDSPHIESEAWLAVPSRSRNEDQREDDRTLAETSASGGGRQRLWGRAADRRRLLSFARHVEDGAGQVVIVEGFGGVGKSELTEELVYGVAEQGRFTNLHGRYQSSAGAELGLREALDRFLGTTGQGPARLELSVQEFLRRFGEQDPREVADLVGFLRPSLNRQEGAERAATGSLQQLGFALVLRVLRRLARDRPVVLHLDDIHLGGEVSAAFVRYFLFELGYDPSPIWLLATARSGSSAFSRALIDLHGHAGFERMTLEPVSTPALAEGLALEFSLSPDRARALAQRAGGIPLFARILASEPPAKDSPKHDPPALVTVGADQSLPRALQGIIAAHLDERLNATESPTLLRRRLERMAILGDKVSIALLEAYTDDLGGDFDADLDILLELGLLEEDERDEALRFEHGLFADALRGAMSRRRARAAHLRAATVMVAMARAGDFGAIGDHYAAAGQSQDAMRWWLEALEHEGSTGNAQRAVGHARKALELLDDEDSRHDALALRLARLLHETGALPAAVELLTPLFENAEHPDRALQAGELLAEIAHNEGATTRWSRLLSDMAALEQGSEGAGRLALERARLFWSNHHDPHANSLESAQALLASTPSEIEACRLAVRLAWSCSLVGQGALALSMAQRALEAAGERDGLRAEGLRAMGIVRLFRAEFQQTIAPCREAIGLWRRAGRTQLLLRSMIDLALWLALAGQSDEAAAVIGDIERVQGGATNPGEWARFDITRGIVYACNDSLTDELIHNLRARFVEYDALGYHTLTPMLRIAIAHRDLRDGRALDAAELAASCSALSLCPMPASILDPFTRELQQAADDDPALREPTRAYLRHRRAYRERHGLDE